MGELVTVLNAAGGAFVAFAAHMLVQSSVLIILLAALDLVLRRRIKAVVRYWIWLLVLAKLVLPPSFSSPTGVAYWVGGKLPTLSGPIEQLAEESSTLPLPADGTAVPSEPGGPDWRPDNAPLVSHAALRDASITWQALVLFGWAIVVIVMAILLARRDLFIHRLVAQSRVPGPEIVELLGRCARRMGLRPDLAVKLSPLSASPSVCGLRRPVILVPEGMLARLSVPELRSVLFHELAHIKRGDLWLNLLQAALLVVYFYHPFLWAANAWIRRVREQAVDETVLAALGDEAEDYPRTLLSVSRAAFGQPTIGANDYSPLLGVVESEKALMDRIRYMVSRPFPKNARLGFTGLILVFAVGAMLLPMAKAKSDTSRAGETAASAAAPVVPAGSAGPDAGTPAAKAELESKPATGKANPPEAGITPRQPFGKQPAQTLNAWVSLKVLEGCVVTLDGLKPFSEFWARCRWNVAGLLSEKEALDHVGVRLKDKESLPIRVYIYYQPETYIAAQRLRDAIASVAKEAKADLDTELRLEMTTWVGSGESTFYLRDGKIRTLYPLPVLRPDGGTKLLASGLVDPNDLEQHILWRLLMPKNVPLTFRIEYDEASAALAKQVADKAKAVTKRVGLAELVGVTGALVEPVPETVFLGRWQATAGGRIGILDVQPGGVCQATMDQGSEAIQAGASVKGTWLPTTKEIVIDIGDFVKGKNPYVYRASIDAEGNLLVIRGVVYPQGSFHYLEPQPAVFRKVP